MLIGIFCFVANFAKYMPKNVHLIIASTYSVVASITACFVWGRFPDKLNPPQHLIVHITSVSMKKLLFPYTYLEREREGVRNYNEYCLLVDVNHIRQITLSQCARNVDYHPNTAETSLVGVKSGKPASGHGCSCH